MPLSLSDKKAVVAEVNEVASKALSVVAADYRGLTVAELTELRASARNVGVDLKVVRNTLARRALEGTEFECMREALVGPLFLAFSYDAPGAAARLLRDYAKEHDNLEVTALSISGKLLDVSQLSVLANLPTRDEAISKLMFVMKEPANKLARALKETHGKLVRTVAAVRDQKKQAA